MESIEVVRQTPRGREGKTIKLEIVRVDADYLALEMPNGTELQFDREDLRKLAALKER